MFGLGSRRCYEEVHLQINLTGPIRTPKSQVEAKNWELEDDVCTSFSWAMCLGSMLVAGGMVEKDWDNLGHRDFTSKNVTWFVDWEWFTPDADENSTFNKWNPWCFFFKADVSGWPKLGKFYMPWSTSGFIDYYIPFNCSNSAQFLNQFSRGKKIGFGVKMSIQCGNLLQHATDWNFFPTSTSELKAYLLNHWTWNSFGDGNPLLNKIRQIGSLSEISYLAEFTVKKSN